jgi:hypothetical protein
MPVRRVVAGKKRGWKWGSRGKAYFGPGAKQKAERQGRAVKAKGKKHRG